MIARSEQDYLPATALASLGFCEVKLLNEVRFGKQSTATQKAAAGAGIEEHERFHQVVSALHNQPRPAQDRRCFIATAMWGSADPRTQQLRDWRDRVLLTHGFGRGVVRAYYAISPWMVRLMERCPGLRVPAERVLEWVRRALVG
ncbi:MULTISPECIES: CFI-box-CTERM domain-containing protein [unclassified Rhodanobacter]|uniref:CFI-box-CTERM domain-containing protein n=1 Tax=unclassified Rhodanobacter TaxID=2621553 RepID=UPI0007A9DE7E|nr:CFI-box-CTERM domain-containing protein [Rhodanobacter sp. FW510-R10]KZC32644.1 hypothetical protein RhoFW510R10_12075 [Rhodanobacter sp. FW510-R10]